ncbi:MAG: tripartite motif-containing protein 71 [Solirubrobacteraceae bacterium]|jgi:DNA-binding beta-propeller fold protein YncE|nr:tripartite motif-containing protein 71 [Solirubrobacteraceae bacterium]
MTRRALLLVAVLAVGLVAVPAASASRAVIGTFGGPGTGPGQFGSPRADYRAYLLRTGPGGIAFAGSEVVVADPINDRIQRFTRDGRFLGAFGRRGILPGQMLSPHGIAVHRGRLYVVMQGNDRIEVYTLRGRWLQAFHVLSRIGERYAMTRGAGRGQVHNPWGIALGPDGGFSVADMNNGRVQRFSPRGVGRGQVGRFGAGPGQLRAPFGVAVDRAGNLWVSDNMLNRVQKFDSRGRLLLAVGETGSGPGDFLAPQGLATDRAGNLYVADTNNARVVKLAPDGRFLESFGEGVLTQPVHLAVSDDCTVWVSDYRRVVKFAGSC